jgi:hypothetical protein
MGIKIDTEVDDEAFGLLDNGCVRRAGRRGPSISRDDDIDEVG